MIAGRDNILGMLHESIGIFMTSGSTLSCSHWLGFVYTEGCHDVINVARQHMDYIHYVLFYITSALRH